ncbi:MAG: ABC transporter permease [Eubacteriales bacterium]|nr:ABC transporter permease [Eubacteriales bacterium]
MRNKKKMQIILYKYSRVMIFVLMFLFFTFFTDTFFSFSNMNNIRNIFAQQVPFLMLLSIGMTLAIILKGIDLSIGTVLALSSCVAAMVLQATGNSLLCILTGLAVGSFFGLVNGLLISKVGLSPYIATYSIQWISKGIAYVLLAGTQIYNFPGNFRQLFTGWFYTLLLIAFIVSLIMWFLMSKTTFGRNVYVVGNNSSAARLSGVKVDMIYIVTFTIIGFLASLTGLMYIANLGAAEPIIGDSFALQAIAATLIGGTSFGGGKGSVFSAIIGSMIMITLTNGLLHMGVGTYWQQFAIGVVIVFSIILERGSARLLKD